MAKTVTLDKESPREEFERRIKEIAAELNEFFNRNEDNLKNCGVVFLASLDNGQSLEGQTFIIGAPKIISATITESCNKFPVFSTLIKYGLPGTHQ